VHETLLKHLTSTKKTFNKMTQETQIIEVPVVTIDEFYNDEKVLIVHSYKNEKGKMILNKQEAGLLLIELCKFISL
jgi:hypothetical protein